MEIKTLDFSSICPRLQALVDRVTRYLYCWEVEGVEELCTSFPDTTVRKEGHYFLHGPLKELFPNIHFLVLRPDAMVG